jgi:general stress protein YciG
MAGTVEGGQKAARTNMMKYGLDFYQKVGAKGGKVRGVKKGFAGMGHERASAAGRKGGQKSRRRAALRNADLEPVKKHWWSR